MPFSTMKTSIVAAVVVLALGAGVLFTQAEKSSKPAQVAFLGLQFQNDNEMYEPTSDLERARIKAVTDAFIKRLTDSGAYTFIPISGELRAKIEAGQDVGECGGCEIDYGIEAGAEKIAWIRVQKVSNLILNMNVYIADMASKKMTFVRSVDIRGNSDESWTRSIEWLMKNYILAPKA